MRAPLPPPYVPFRTLLSALEGLQAGLPNRIDRSLWPSLSGAAQGQLLAAFRFLALVDEDQRPTAALRELTAAPETRQRVLRRLLEKAYAELLALDLTRTSPRQLEELVRRYGYSGATLRKAVSFFLQAAGYAEIPMSVLLRRKTRRGGARRAPSRQAPVKAAAGASRSLRLRSGGSLTLVMDLQFPELTREDREFVFGLLDQMTAYEQNGGAAPVV